MRPRSPDTLPPFAFVWLGALAVAMLATFPAAAQAAEVTTLWQESFRYQGSKYDDRVVGEMKAVSVTPDGGFCLAGEKVTKDRVAADSDRDAWVVRLDATGAVIFDRTFGDDGRQWTHGVSVAPDGGCVAVGYVGSRRDDSFVLRTDPRGDLLWQRTFGGPFVDSAMAVTALPGGDTVVSSSEAPSRDAIPVLRLDRLDRQGKPVWTRRPERIAGSGRRIVALDGDHVLVTGPLRVRDAPFGYSAVEFDDNGEEVWSTTLDEKGWARAFVAVPRAGHAIAFYGEDAAPWPTVRVKRFDSRARELWRTEVPLFGDSISPAAYRPGGAGIALLADGGIALIVQRDFHHNKVADPRTYTDHWLLRFDFDGRMTARHLLEGERPDEIDTVDIVRAIAAAPDGSLVMVGETIWPWHPEVGGRDDSWLRRVELP